MSSILDLSIEDKLYRTRYEPDTAHSHIQVNGELCVQCTDKPCLRFCSGDVYKTDPNDATQVTVSHENCLECGTCRHGCPFKAITWNYPEGGMGVKFRFG